MKKSIFLNIFLLSTAITGPNSINASASKGICETIGGAIGYAADTTLSGLWSGTKGLVQRTTKVAVGTGKLGYNITKGTVKLCYAAATNRKSMCILTVLAIAFTLNYYAEWVTMEHVHEFMTTHGIPTNMAAAQAFIRTFMRAHNIPLPEDITNTFNGYYTRYYEVLIEGKKGSGIIENILSSCYSSWTSLRALVSPDARKAPEHLQKVCDAISAHWNLWNSDADVEAAGICSRYGHPMSASTETRYRWLHRNDPINP